MTWWIWIVLGFFLLLIELVTPGGLYLLFFGVAAIIVGLLAAAEVSGPDWAQWLWFSLLSILTVVFFRRPLMKRIRPTSQPQEVDSLVGEVAVALQDVDIDGFGKAELRGSSWTIRNVGGAVLKQGQRCKVEQVEGLMLWVRGQ
ncbi:MAG: NfeD family protein [Acidobacteriota bacterium]